MKGQLILQNHNLLNYFTVNYQEKNYLSIIGQKLAQVTTIYLWHVSKYNYSCLLVFFVPKYIKMMFFLKKIIF
jgi:hypothetical protein